MFGENVGVEVLLVCIVLVKEGCVMVGGGIWGVGE